MFDFYNLSPLGCKLYSGGDLCFVHEDQVESLKVKFPIGQVYYSTLSQEYKTMLGT